MKLRSFCEVRGAPQGAGKTMMHRIFCRSVAAFALTLAPVSAEAAGGGGGQGGFGANFGGGHGSLGASLGAGSIGRGSLGSRDIRRCKA